MKKINELFRNVKVDDLVQKIKATTLKQRLIYGGSTLLVLALVIGGGIALQNQSFKSASANQSNSKQNLLAKHLKADKLEADKQAKATAVKKANDEKQAKLKAEQEAKAKKEAESKASAEKASQEKAQAEQVSVQVQADTQAQADEQAQVTTAQSEQPVYTAPVETPQAQTPSQSTPQPTTPPTNNEPDMFSEQWYLNAGFIHAPYPEGSIELGNWLADQGYGGYTGNGEGLIRPY